MSLMAPHWIKQTYIRIYTHVCLIVRIYVCTYACVSLEMLIQYICSHAILYYVYIHIVYIVGMSIIIMVIRIINIVLHSYHMYNMYLFIVYTYIHCRCNHSIIETCTAVDGTLCVGRSRNVLMAAIGMAQENRFSNGSKSREVAHMQCETASANAGV